jgi:RNA ligase
MSNTPATVRDLIRTDADWLRTLETVYKISVSRDGSLVSLKYNQIESPMSEPIVQQCRGMVVDVERGMILAHPYDKFWNHGEPGAATIDWSTARVQEKLDGSLMLLWYSVVDMRWRVSSSGHPTAGGEFGYDASRTFADAFWQTFVALKMRIPPLEEGCYTFMFELCAKENRIVVKHDQPRLVLHGARDMETGREVPREKFAELAAECCWEIVREFPIGTIEDCLAAVEQLDPIATEGFVVVDGNFNRVKIKSPRYVLLHHMRGEGMSQRRAIELWQSGETAEVLANFPEFTPEVDAVQGKIDSAITSAYRLWQQNAAAPTRKDFALAVKDSPGSSIAFKLVALGRPALLDDATAVVRAMTVPAIQRLIDPGLEPMP